MKLFTRLLNKNFFKSMILLVGFLALCSHNLYIKMDSYFLKPNQEAVLNLYNGSFEMSENIITRDRILDASLVAQGKRMAIDSSKWRDQDSTITQLNFNTGDGGTYVVGVSTKARNIELSAEKFNSYLKSDGVLDMLEERIKDSLLQSDAVERYEKHVKAIYQVGDLRTEDWKTVLGYPIEFVPQSNPYDSYTEGSIEFQLLLDGQPLANQLVYADYIASGHDAEHGHGGKQHAHKHQHGNEQHKHDGNKHSHDKDAADSHEHDHGGKKHAHQHKHGDEGHKHKHDGQEQANSDDKDTAHSHEHEHGGKKHAHKHQHGNEQQHEHEHEDESHDHDHDSTSEEGHSHPSGQQLRTNAQGIISVDLLEDGVYYLRTIHMVQNTDDSDEITHASKWATLSFEVTHKHDSTTHTHEDHGHEREIPTWWFILGSVLIIGALFFVFRKKS